MTFVCVCGEVIMTFVCVYVWGGHCDLCVCVGGGEGHVIDPPLCSYVSVAWLVVGYWL